MAAFLQLLVKFLPMILSLISALTGGGIALQSHQMIAAAPPGTFADTAWMTHVGGSAGAGGVLAALFAAIQPIASKAIEQLQFEQLLADVKNMPPERKARIKQASEG